MLTLKQKEPEKKEPEENVVFKVGDTVRLNGMMGPTMVIEDFEDDTNKATVVYFDFAGNNFHRIKISVDVLTHFKPKA